MRYHLFDIIARSARILRRRGNSSSTVLASHIANRWIASSTAHNDKLKDRFRGTSPPGMTDMPTTEQRLARAKFRAWHRGTREADYMIGGFFDRYAASWAEAEIDWFEDLLAEDDVDVMAWALGTAEVPERFQGAQMELMRKLDYVDIPR